MQKVISIAGTGRSGTNILKKIFSLHDNIATLPFEYRFIIDPRGVIDFYNRYTSNWSPYKADFEIKEFESFLQSLAKLSSSKKAETVRIKEIDPKGLELTPPPYAGWELNEWIPGFEKKVNSLIETLTSFEYNAVWPGIEANQENYHMSFGKRLSKIELAQILANFLDDCIKAICAVQGKEIYLEDNTHNILFASDLKTLMPNIKLVHIIRDPRDVISSLQKQKWAPSDLNQLIIWYNEVMNQWFDQKSKLNSNDYLELKFEDLIANTQHTIEQICQFSGITFQNQLLNVDLENHNIGRFLESFSATEIKLIEQKTAHIGAIFKYY